jgi:hypothetical protein
MPAEQPSPRPSAARFQEDGEPEHGRKDDPEQEEPQPPRSGEAVSDDDPLDAAGVQDLTKRLFKGQAYKYRNRYKSVMSHMCIYVKNNRDDLINILRAASFPMTKIEHALYKVSFDFDSKQKREKVKNAQSIVLRMLSKKTIFTYILCEATQAMLRHWRTGNIGKIARDNLSLYIEACQAIHEEAVHIVGQEAQGTSFVF